MGGQCEKIKEDGERCQSRAVAGSEFCFFHADPEKLREATRKGGSQGKTKTLDESNLSISTVADVLRLIETSINEVRSGKIDRGIANAVGYLATVLLKAFEMDDFAKRIKALEDILNLERLK